MAVNYPGKKFFNIGSWWQTYYTAVIYRGILTLENVTSVINYHNILITLAPDGVNNM
jgi:hypothetical protein